MSLVERTPCAGRVDPWALYRLLEQGRFNLTTETLTQYDIWQLLNTTYPPSLISREHRLSAKDRPDFLVDGRIVIEVKGDRHRAPAVLRQLERYAGHDEVEAIILATGRAMVMPAAILGKPCRVLTLGSAWL